MNEIAETATTLDNMPCLNCGYNLRGLMPDGNCPECGNAIAQSIAFFGFRNVTTRWFTAVRCGIVIYGVSVGANFTWLTVIWTLRLFSGHGIWQYELRWGTVGRIIELILDLAPWWALHLIAERPITIEGYTGNDRRARMLRYAATTTLALALYQWLNIYNLISAMIGRHNIEHTGLLQVMWLAPTLVAAWVYWALFGLVSEIAGAIGKVRIRNQAIALRCILCSACLLLGLEYIINILLYSWGIQWANVRSNVENVLRISAVIILLAGIVWATVVMIRIFRLLGLYRASAPHATLPERSPWIPAAAVAAGQALKHIREFASYNGNRGPQ